MDGTFTAHTIGERPLISYVPPSGFSAGSDGIYVETIGKDGEVKLEWLCSPLAVVATGSNAQQSAWSRCLEFVDPDEVVQRRYVLERDLSGAFSKVLSDLTDHGLKIAGSATARRQLKELIARWAPDARYKITDRLGWADATCKAFVLGDRSVIGKSNVVFLNPAAPEGVPATSRRGTLEQWRAEVAARCEGNPILVAAVSLAFTGPLLELLDKDSIGIHLRGRSSSGKTTALGAAVSVWGSPKMMHSWRATANALEGIAATCNSSLLALDELGLVSGREVGDAIYTLANGQGKARSSSRGRLQPPNRWRLTMLSTGEISLADKMAEAGKTVMTGQEVRLIDIKADTGRHGVFDVLHGAADSSIFARATKEAAAEHFGTAGPAFIEKVIRTADLRNRLSSMCAGLTGAWRSKLGVMRHGPSGRILEHFAMMGVAGELATRFGITGWQQGAANSAALALAKDWCDAQDRSEQSQIEAAVTRTRAYLLAHGDTRFERAGSTPMANPAGYRDDTWFYIASDPWNAIHVGYSPTDQAKHLIASGWMVRGDGKNLMSKTPNWVPGRPRAYMVRTEILKIPSGTSVPATPT